MPGSNTTGKPNTSFYNLGRGKLYFAPLDVNGRPQGYRELGNCPEFNLNIESEKLEHQSSQGGLKVIDKEVIIATKLNVNFSLDEISFENQALFFSGTQAAAPTNAAIAGFADYNMITDVVKGRWYDIVNASNVRAYDLLQNSDVTVQKTPSTAMAVGVDYELDLKFGRIFFLTSGVVIVDGDEVDVALVAHASAKALQEVQCLTQTNIIGALKFIGSNAADSDKQTEYQIHKISLKPEGDFAQIGDEFTTMGFTGAAESNTVAGGNSPLMTIRYHLDA